MGEIKEVFILTLYSEITNQTHMEDMEDKVYGFLLSDNVLFNLETKKLVHYEEESYQRTMSFKTASLNDTQTRLLTCLLINSNKNVIYKDDIMKTVWDKNGFSSSNQRLWQTVNELRKKLSFIGLPDDFVSNIHGIGYAISNSRIRLLLIT